MIRFKKGRVAELGIGGTLVVGIIFCIVGVLMLRNNTATNTDAISTINSIAWMFIVIGVLAVVGAIIAGIMWLKKTFE